MSNKKIKDLNDARMHLKGDFLKLALGKAKPMRVIENEEDNVEGARDGWMKLREIVQYCLTNMSDPQDCISYISSFTTDVGLFGRAYLEYEDEMDVEFLRLRAIQGISQASDIFKRSVKKECRLLKADERRKKILNSIKGGSWGEKPNEYTWKKLEKKTVRIGGETIEGAAKNTWLNFEIIFRTDPKWSGRLAWSNLHQQSMIDGEVINDITLTKIQSWLAKTYGVQYDNPKQMDKWLNFIAQDNKIHPVQEWLDGIRWDGQHRLKNMAREIFHSPDASVLNMFGDNGEYKHFGIEGRASLPQIAIIRSFISAVARACDPGCKVDWLPILIGTQGAGKSQTIEALSYNPKWFATVRFDVRKKDAITNCMGKWICEYAECETLSKYGHSSVKQFFSSPKDRVQLNYAVYSTDIPRTNVFWGTTNKEELELLNDTTGSRRFCAFRVGKINRVQLYDPEYICQIWAEAMYYYSALGERWWLEGLEAAARDRLNKRYRQIDIWEERLDNIIAHRAGMWVDIKNGQLEATPETIKAADESISLTLLDICEEFGLELERLSKKEKRRIEDAIKHLGCESYGTRMSGGSRVTIYRPTEEYLVSLSNYKMLIKEDISLDRQEF